MEGNNSEKPRTITEDSSFHGIIILEGFRDKDILESFKLIGKKESNEWTLLKVSIEPSLFQHFLIVVQSNLLVDENGIPFYAHFYRNNSLIIVFPKKIFQVTCDKESWKEVIAYGISLGISEFELDFKPNKINEEEY